MHACFKLLISWFQASSLLISWLQSLSTVILEPKKIKPVTTSIVSHSTGHEVMTLDAMILVFGTYNFKPAFSLSSFTLIKRLFRSSSLSAIRVISSAYLKLLVFSQQSWFQLVIHPSWHFALWILHVSKIYRVTIYSFVILLSQFWTSQVFHVWL